MIAKILVFLIRSVYQQASRRFWGRTCRFNPTCSEYVAQAIEKYGCIKGLYLGTWRIIRCNPWNPGGDDPIP